MDEKTILMSKEDFDTLFTFRTICEQVLDYLGIHDGTIKLNEMFPDNGEWVDAVIVGYIKGDRLSEKRDEPDEEILRLIQ